MVEYSTTTLQETIEKQDALVESLKKRIAGIDSMIAQGNQERAALVADVLKEIGVAEGLRAALAISLRAKAEKEAKDASMKGDAP